MPARRRTCRPPSGPDGPQVVERQLPLDLAHAEARGREDLVLGTSNAAAVDLVDRWPAWPTPVVVLAGPPGSGKSHLAEIWAREAGAVRLDAASIADGLAGAGGATAFLVDDADRGRLDETGLFHLVNTVAASGGALLLVSRRFPLAWGVRLPDLASRLRAATIVEIGEPGEALLEAVMTKLFADRQVTVEPHVVAYVVRRMERSLQTALDLVGRLDKAALARGSRISRTLAAEVMTAGDTGQRELDVGPPREG